jgi:CHAD domain-containing protein
VGDAWALPPTPQPASSPTAPAVVRQTESGLKLDVHRSDSAALFYSAEQNFNRSWSPQKLRLELKEVSAGQPVSDAQLERLKIIRKDGNILRHSFVLFDKDHESPPKLDAFVTKFGKMNDALASGNRETAAQYAQKVLKTLDARALKKEISSFEPASHKSFNKHLAAEREELEAGLAKKTISAPEFHDLRKSLTKVLTVLTLSSDRLKDPAGERFYKRVLSLQTEMGELHDNLVAKGMRGEIDYDHHEVTIPPKMRADLKAVLDTLR